MGTATGAFLVENGVAAVKVAHNRVVTFVFRLVDQDGLQIDQALSDAPIQYLHGHQHLKHSIDSRLEGHHVGDQLAFTVEIPTAGGEFLVPTVPDSAVNDGSPPPVGTPFLAEVGGEKQIAWVTRVSPEGVSVSTADPLAGRTMRFSVAVVAVWKATTDEIRRGFPSGVIPNSRRRNFKKSSR